VAQEDLIQAERNLIYKARTFEAFRRDFLVSIANDYFNLLQTQTQIKNQETQLETVKRIERQRSALFDAGRVAEFDKNTASNNVLQATADLAGQHESYILALERFKIRLGFKSEQAIDLAPISLELPDPDISLDEATGLAMAYRLDLQNQRDQLDDAHRGVQNAKNALLPDLNFATTLGIPTRPTAREGGIAFQPEDTSYNAALTFGLPLDREQERLNLRSATINYGAQQRNYARNRDEVAVGVRQAVRTIDLARFQLRLAEDQVHINERRVQELAIKAAEVDAQRQLDAANNLQQSEDSLARARTSLRNAILTFLRDSGQLRVRHDGTLEPLPGMELTPKEPFGPPAPPPPPAEPAPAGAAG
jgi:outer membrane protein TolC